MATADPKKKKKKRRKKESLEHKRNRILVALAVFVAVYVLDELGVLERTFGNPGNVYASFMLFLVPFVIAGHDVLKKPGTTFVTAKHLTRASSWPWPRSALLLWCFFQTPTHTWQKEQPLCSFTRWESSSRPTP